MIKAKELELEEKKLSRTDILEIASALTGNERNKVYGEPKVNLSHNAALLTAYFKNKIWSRTEDFSTLKDYNFTPEDTAMIQVLAKVSRIAVGKFKDDNYIDLAAYAAIAGELT